MEENIKSLIKKYNEDILKTKKDLPNMDYFPRMRANAKLITLKLVIGDLTKLIKK